MAVLNLGPEMIKKFTLEAHARSELVHPKKNIRMRLFSHPDAVCAS